MVKRNITIDKTGIDELLKTPDISNVEKYTLLSMKILLEKYIQQEKEELNKENIKVLPPQKQPDNVLIDTNAQGLICTEEPVEQPDIPHYDSMSQIKLGNLCER